MLGDINKNLQPYEHRLFLCKPNKETIAELKEAYNKKLILNYGGIHELSFTIPFIIEKNKKYIRNPHVDIIKGHYLIRYEEFDKNTSTIINKEYFIITKPKNVAQDGVEYKEIQCYLLPYELNNKILRNYTGTKTINEVLTETLLVKSTWTIGNIDYNLQSKSRTFDVSEKSLTDFINEIADTFNAVIVWDTVNRKINFYENENLGENQGLNIEYGKYLKNIGEEPDFDNVVTRLYVYGKDGLSINRLTPTGLDYVEDFSYYLYPYSETITDQINDIYTVNLHSNYMTDKLCHAILKYNKLLKSKSPIKSVAETGTTTTNIKITSHGLITGDYIVNETRNNIVRKITVVDANNFTVSSIGGQTSGDIIYKYFEGTFGKLLYRKEDLQASLTVKENELSTLQTDLVIILDDIDIALADNQQYYATITYNINNKVVYNNIPYQCIQQTVGYLPTNTSYWENLITKKSNKQTQINNKQAEITQINSNISNIDLQIDTLQGEISVGNNFTAEQIIERDNFIREKTWSDTNYYNDKELYNEAVKRLSRMNQPLVSYEVDIVDFLKVVECQRDWNKLKLGDIINIRYSNFNINIKAKIIKIEHDVNNNYISLVIANDKDIKNGFLTLKDLLNNSVSTSTQVDMNKWKWDKSEENNNQINNIINNIWDATKTSIKAGINESVEISNRGIIIKDPNDPNNMLIAQHGVLALSGDGGNSWKHAILPSGIVAEQIFGKLGVFCKVRTDQIILGDSGEKIGDGVIGSSDTWNNSVQKDISYNSTYINNNGIKVIDPNSIERVILGQYAPNKYGFKAINGEIYSTTIRSGNEGDTSYIELAPGFQPLLVKENGKDALTIWTVGGGGAVQFYDTNLNDMRGRILPYNDAIGQGLRIEGRNNVGISMPVHMEGSFVRIDSDSDIILVPGASPYDVTVSGNLFVTGTMSAGGGKPARQATENYGERNLYARESPDVRYIVEDIAQFVNGECRIELNPVFLECIEPNTEVTPWIPGNILPLLEPIRDVFVSEIGDTYFLLKEPTGQSNTRFFWSLSAVRKGFAGMWLEEYDPGEDVLTSGWEDQIEGVV